MSLFSLNYKCNYMKSGSRYKPSKEGFVIVGKLGRVKSDWLSGTIESLLRGNE